MHFSTIKNTFSMQAFLKNVLKRLCMPPFFIKINLSIKNIAAAAICKYGKSFKNKPI